MARWQPAKQHTLSELGAEITHNYPRGATYVAVDGVDCSSRTLFADDLAEVLREIRTDVIRLGIDDVRPVAEMLVVADGNFLDRHDLAGSWHFLVWLDAGSTSSARRVASRTIANALINNDDPEHPRRVFADSC